MCVATEAFPGTAGHRTDSQDEGCFRCTASSGKRDYLLNEVSFTSSLLPSLTHAQISVGEVRALK